MATIKAYTDIYQSKKLAEILPLESADMFWADGERPAIWNNKDVELDDDDVPCWSLAALLHVLPYTIKLSHDVIDANNNPAYKNECYKFSINRCGFFGDKWNTQYYGKQQRQLGKIYKELYIDLFISHHFAIDYGKDRNIGNVQRKVWNER